MQPHGRPTSGADASGAEDQADVAVVDDAILVQTGDASRAGLAAGTPGGKQKSDVRGVEHEILVEIAEASAAAAGDRHEGRPETETIERPGVGEVAIPGEGETAGTSETMAMT